MKVGTTPIVVTGGLTKCHSLTSKDNTLRPSTWNCPPGWGSSSREGRSQPGRRLASRLNKKYQEIEKLRQDYQAEEILLTETMKNKRQEEIINREQAARDFQKEKFGVDGELFKKRKELCIDDLKTIMERRLFVNLYQNFRILSINN